MFFIFKQKTAYEMRISDWSSDVCSSDLLAADRRVRIAFQGLALDAFCGQPLHQLRRAVGADDRDLQRLFDLALGPALGQGQDRSEEHTSELQSLMRISYAVFCLKKQRPNITSMSYCISIILHISAIP